MIVIGYQGIGKSTTVARDSNHRFIDLESGNFWLYNEDGTKYRNPEWYKEYCNIAIDLSSQGFIVFTSSHKVVRDYIGLNNAKEKVVYCMPIIELKDLWIQRLEDRYNTSQLDKDYRAMMNAKDIYEENIMDMRSDAEQYNAKICWISSMKYELSTLCLMMQ